MESDVLHWTLGSEFTIVIVMLSTAVLISSALFLSCCGCFDPKSKTGSRKDKGSSVQKGQHYAGSAGEYLEETDVESRSVGKTTSVRTAGAPVNTPATSAHTRTDSSHVLDDASDGKLGVAQHPLSHSSIGEDAAQSIRTKLDSQCMDSEGSFLIGDSRSGAKSPNSGLKLPETLSNVSSGQLKDQVSKYVNSTLEQVKLDLISHQQDVNERRRSPDELSEILVYMNQEHETSV